MGWVVLHACFVGWVGLGPLATGLGWVGSQKMDPRPCLVRTSRGLTAYVRSCRMMSRHHWDARRLTTHRANPGTQCRRLLWHCRWYNGGTSNAPEMQGRTRWTQTSFPRKFFFFSANQWPVLKRFASSSTQHSSLHIQQRTQQRIWPGVRLSAPHPVFFRGIQISKFRH